MPRTEAGRSLLAHTAWFGTDEERKRGTYYIDAIEAEAAALDEEALRAAFVAVGFDLADDLTPDDGKAAVAALAAAYAAALAVKGAK